MGSGSPSATHQWCAACPAILHVVLLNQACVCMRGVLQCSCYPPPPNLLHFGAPEEVVARPTPSSLWCCPASAEVRGRLVLSWCCPSIRSSCFIFWMGVPGWLLWAVVVAVVMVVVLMGGCNSWIGCTACDRSAHLREQDRRCGRYQEAKPGADDASSCRRFAACTLLVAPHRGGGGDCTTQ